MIPVLVGATASGKTELLAALFGPGCRLEGRAEIVSADSMQAYRGMDIGTAKPDGAFRSCLPHHLIDILEPSESFSAGDYVHLALEALKDIGARGRLPIVAGGTGFYVRNLVLGLPAVPPSDPVIRAEVAGDLATKGASVLREELAVCDPESAARIHANDLYRLTRALEILRATGRPLASFLPKKVDREASPPPWLIIHYRRPRDELRARIAARVDAMLAEGLAEEVSALRRAGHGPEEPGMKAIGYAEFFTLEAEGLSGSALLAAARDRITTNSIHYAKRQETFFRSLPGAVILEAGPCASDDFATLLGPCLKDLSS